MARKGSTPPYDPYPSWSSAKFFSFLRSGLRSKAGRWPPKYEALANAKRIYTGDNKRQKYEYKCAKCKKWFMQKDVSVDHIIPIGTLRSFDDLPDFCRKLFCGVDGLQVLCTKNCHAKKTLAESKERREQRSSPTIDGLGEDFDKQD